MRHSTIPLLVFAAATFARGEELTFEAALARARTSSPIARAADATERVTVARQDETLAREIERIAQRRFELGDVAVIDVNATKADAAQAHSETLVAEGERDSALARLRALLGYTPDAGITI